jgi:hypothetical protein
MADDDGHPKVIPVAPDAPASGKDFDKGIAKPSGDGPSKTWEVEDDDEKTLAVGGIVRSG